MNSIKSSFWFVVYHDGSETWYTCPHTMVHAGIQQIHSETDEQLHMFQYLSSNWFSHKTDLYSANDYALLKFGIVETKKVTNGSDIMKYVNHINDYLKRDVHEDYESNFVRAFHMFKIGLEELCQSNDFQGRFKMSPIASIVEDTKSFTSVQCDKMHLEIHFRKLETDEVIVSTPNLLVHTQS